jgi:hypothetical protein
MPLDPPIACPCPPALNRPARSFYVEPEPLPVPEDPASRLLPANVLFDPADLSPL